VTFDISAKLFMEKAERALLDARILLDNGRGEGACNRAYYAMFDAAHAALFSQQVEPITAPIKTHVGLIAKFGEHLVRPGHLAAHFGEALNRVQRFRQIADYSGEPIELVSAAWSVEQAEAFVAAVKARFEL
jgi:uncharacterized protein (UPF0332 family)